MKSFAAAALSLSMPQPAFAESLELSRGGSRSSTPGPAEYFTGSVRVEMAFAAKDPGRTSGGYVTFAPGARSAWHTHPIVQVLVVTEGVGRVQEP